MSQSSSIFLELTQNSLHIWKIKLPLESKFLTLIIDYLSNEEKVKARKFHFEADQYRYQVSRGLLRKLIGSYLEIEPSQVKFYYNYYGKPLLIERNLQFNLSHSKDYILIAISYDTPVGVDIEYCKKDIDISSLAKEICTLDEYKVLSFLSQPERYEAFYRCWTRKEAVLKATGFGLSFPLSKLDVLSFDNEIYERNMISLQKLKNFDVKVKDWFLMDLKIDPNYMAAISTAKELMDVRFLDVNTSLKYIFEKEVSVLTANEFV